ncbi:uncharacterized protein LOC132281080 [Cornus florida]|uniref:uncharacterized protein LOC132281080 n=1 Tax=Cornus florida TaxID=4283 RepID=UPI0028967A21|nr:uncharacterized protein LOC132281080 [Cornus florida]
MCYHSVITFRNIEILRQNGVPDSKIVWVCTYYPRLLEAKPDRLNEVLEDVKKIGFNPSKFQFVIAIQALMASKSTWKRRMEVYRKWGWSEEETMLAFTKHPWCMMISEKKIMVVLNFYVNTMGLIKEPISIWTLLDSTESLFLKKFVTCYEEAPQLLKLYQEKLDLSKLHGRDYDGKSGSYLLPN